MVVPEVKRVSSSNGLKHKLGNTAAKTYKHRPVMPCRY